ncbi:MAG: ROK family protein [Planctomycetota bacterium]|jgi:predicted NBD/HSP70 family sugar kinase
MRLCDVVADKIAQSAAIVINLYDPDTLILAGYVIMGQDYFIKQIQSRFASDLYDPSSRNIEIMFARAGQQALIKGVVAAVLQEQFKIE